MTVFIFQPRFVQPILARKKRQTIRETSRCEPNDILSLRAWESKAYRSRQVEIIPPVVCDSVLPLRLSLVPFDNRADIAIGSTVLTHDEVCRFVRADGFDCVSDFVGHWVHLGIIDFDGYLIEWRYADE